MQRKIFHHCHTSLIFLLLDEEEEEEEGEEDEEEEEEDNHLHHISGLHAAVAEDNRVWSSGHRKSKGVGTHNACSLILRGRGRSRVAMMEMVMVIMAMNMKGDMRRL